MRQVLEFLGFVQLPLRVEGGVDIYHSRTQGLAVDSEAAPARTWHILTSEPGRYDNVEFGTARD